MVEHLPLDVQATMFLRLPWCAWWKKIKRRSIIPELCAEATKDILDGRLGLSGSILLVLVVMRRSSSVLLLGPVGCGVACLVAAGFASVP